MDREKSKKLGLSIKTRDNRVIVCGVEVNSLSAEHLQVLDHIVFVSRSRVTQSEVAQLLLIKALKVEKENRSDLSFKINCIFLSGAGKR